MTIQLPKPLHTARLTIRIITEDDLPALLPFYSDPDYIRYLPNPQWHSMDDAQAWYQRVNTRQQAGEVLQFVIEEKASGAIVGICLVFGFDAPGQRAEIGYALGPAYQGQGFMREAITALLHFCFVILDLRRLDAGMDPQNLASRKVVDHFGFTHEGRIREKTVMQGRLVDTDLFGLLKREWLARQA